MNTSIKPKSGARKCFPFEMKIMRRVPKVTSQMRAKKMKNGRKG
jgi:hypothetical protein